MHPEKNLNYKIQKRVKNPSNSVFKIGN